MKTSVNQQFPHLDERQFALAVERMADSLGYGAQRSPFIGASVDYVQSRMYQFGDSVKNIDWRITARTGKTFVKEYEASKHMPVFIMVDDSGSMMTGSGGHTKYEWTILLASALALASIRQLSAVGMLTCGQSDQSLRFNPSLSRAQVYQWAYLLRKRSKGPGWRKTDISKKIRDISDNSHEKHLIIVLSDFHEADVESAVKHVAQMHEVIALKMQDPVECGKVGRGIFRAREAEIERHFVVSGQRCFQSYDSFIPAMRKSGVRAMTLNTGINFIPVLRMFLGETYFQTGAHW